MTDKELAQYLLQALNMALGSIMQGEATTPIVLILI